MSKKISVDELSRTISDMLEEFEGATDEQIEQALKTTSTATLEELRNANPPGSGKWGSWKEYNKDWKVSTTKRSKYKTATIHNKSHYQLTHLLERGHAITSSKGGRSKTKAYPHILQAAENAEEKFMAELEKELK